jgi:hypothetical protein
MKNTKSNEVFITKRTFASKRQSADIDIWAIDNAKGINYQITLLRGIYDLGKIR